MIRYTVNYYQAGQIVRFPNSALLASIAVFAAARSKGFISFSVTVLVPDSAVLLLQAINKDVIEKITRTVSSCFIKKFLSEKILMIERYSIPNMEGNKKAG